LNAQKKTVTNDASSGSVDVMTGGTEEDWFFKALDEVITDLESIKGSGKHKGRKALGLNGVVHGNLRDFCDRSQRRMKHPPGHRHQFENLGTSLVFPRFNAVRTLTYDGARALLLR